MSMSMASIGMGFIIWSLTVHHDDSGWKLIREIFIVGGIMSYVASYAWGLGICMWVILIEILPTRVRAAGFGAFVTVQWVINIAVAYSLKVILALGDLTVRRSAEQPGNSAQNAANGTAVLSFIYAIFGVFAFLFVRYIVPETRGNTMVI